MGFKSGFVSIIGRPNVGKSTLMNQFIGQKLSIVTPKASTTRHRILGVLNGEDYQIVFSDTPGIIKSAYKLHDAMMDFVWSAVDDSDLVIYMLEAGGKPDDVLIEKIQKFKKPLIILLNKIDLSTQLKVEAQMKLLLENPAISQVIPISALHGFEVTVLIDSIKHHLPEGMPYFPDDQITDRTERFFAAEIIREQLFLLYEQEIPYSCEVVVEDFKEYETITEIRAFIMVEREGQKGILVGKAGSGIKKIGTRSRIQLEEFLQKKVFLDLRVKVAENWRKKDIMLKRFGYK
jgi:GTP-binding protein Era